VIRRDPALVLLLLLGLGGCSPAGDPPPAACIPDAVAAARCPAERPAPPRLPGQRLEHSLAEFWLARTPEPSRLLLDEEGVARLNRRLTLLRDRGEPVGRWDLGSRVLAAGEPEQLLDRRLSRLRERVHREERVGAQGEPGRAVLAEIEANLAASQPADELRVATTSTAIRCQPSAAPLLEAPGQEAFDTLQCSLLSFGEPVRVLRKSSNFWLILTEFVQGWVTPTALGPALAPAELAAYRQAPRFLVITQDRAPVLAAPGGELLGVARLGQRLPLLDATAAGYAVRAPHVGGLGPAWIPAGSGAPGYLPLTRETVFRLAFSLLHSPYGWGGAGDGRDCSAFLMDLFAVCGLALPRNSAQQAEAGSEQVDLAAQPLGGRVAAIEAASRRGLVLLYLPGHIMLYLGRDGDDLYALHQLSGYLVPCPGGGETKVRVNRVAVTPLTLGRGTSQGSLLERLTRLTVLGPR